MKKGRAYTINSHVGAFICGKGGSTISLVRDNEQKPIDQELARRFRDAMTMFRMRVELLAKIDHKTTKEEEDSLSAMLQVLLEGKRILQK